MSNAVQRALSLLIAPTIAAFCASALVGLVGSVTQFDSPDRWRSFSLQNALEDALSLWGFGVVFALLANCTIGVIWKSIAQQKGIHSWPLHVVAGALSAASIAALLLSNLWFSDNYWRLLHLMSWAVLIGSVTGYLTWLVNFPGRARRSNPPTSPP
jgi:hypothetical protein